MTTTKTTWQIEQDLEQLERDYADAVRTEYAEHLPSELIKVIQQSTSGWSGGHGSRNMCEQIKRTEAMRLLDRNTTWEMHVEERPQALARAIRHHWARITVDEALVENDELWSIKAAAEKIVSSNCIHDQAWHQALGEPGDAAQAAEHAEDRLITSIGALKGQPGILSND